MPVGRRGELHVGCPEPCGAPRPRPRRRRRRMAGTTMSYCASALPASSRAATVVRPAPTPKMNTLLGLAGRTSDHLRIGGKQAGDRAAGAEHPAAAGLQHDGAGRRRRGRRRRRSSARAICGSRGERDSGRGDPGRDWGCASELDLLEVLCRGSHGSDTRTCRRAGRAGRATRRRPRRSGWSGRRNRRRYPGLRCRPAACRPPRSAPPGRVLPRREATAMRSAS